MRYNNKLNYIFNLIYILFFSSVANAAETVPQAALGLPGWIGMSSGLVVLWLILRFYGKLSYEPQAG